MSTDSSQVDLTGDQTSTTGPSEEQSPQETLVDDEEVEPSEPSGGRSEESGSGNEQPQGEPDTLTEYGVEEDVRPRNTRRDQPDGKLQQDARITDEADPEPGEQEKLFPDVDDSQQTLTGDPAATQCLFEE